jgi:hypothetical protein
MKIYRANYESRNFSFEAYGQTKSAALDALNVAIAKHNTQYKISNPSWFYPDDVSLQAYDLNTPYRDREVMR